MGKLWICLPMISMLLLTGCGGGVSRAEQEALSLRGEYLELNACTAQTEITADYGQRVVRYTADAAVEGEHTVLNLTAPETVAGITVHLDGQDSTLEYDGMTVETGVLDGEKLTPLNAIPALLEAVRSGYITACSYTDEELLRVDCGDPELGPGKGRETSLWFDGEGNLLRGELSQDGRLVVSCDFSEFHRELERDQNAGQKNDAYLGGDRSGCSDP